MRLGRTVAIISDVHGAGGTLANALAVCRAEGVETVALLGDLFDRLEQADAVARALAGWHVVGVRGNHEREALRAAASGQAHIHPAAAALLGRLRERLVLEDVCLVHQENGWGQHDPLAALLGRDASHRRHYPARLTFAGDTHVRHARDDRGPLDIGRGVVRIDPQRRYLINPGALALGQFAIWDRRAGVVRFLDVPG